MRKIFNSDSTVIITLLRHRLLVFEQEDKVIQSDMPSAFGYCLWHRNFFDNWAEWLYIADNCDLESSGFIFSCRNISFVKNQNIKKRSLNCFAFKLKIEIIFYVPVSQLERYSSISGVNSSIETPIARSFKLAIS